jgi:Predicted ATPase of the PP-loop superfamily implicated in cell cycle control
LRDIGVSWWVDPQNSDRNLLRPRVRHDVLPLLEEALGPGVQEALARTADLLREDNDFLEGLAEEAVATGNGLGTEALQELPPVIASRVIRTAVSSITGEALSHAHTTAVMALVTDWRGQGPIDVPGGTVRRVGSELVVTKTSSSSAAGETH